MPPILPIVMVGYSSWRVWRSVFLVFASYGPIVATTGAFAHGRPRTCRGMLHSSSIGGLACTDSGSPPVNSLPKSHGDFVSCLAAGLLNGQSPGWGTIAA